MRALPTPPEIPIKPTHYRLKELTISYEANLKYRVVISIGFLVDEVFNEVTTIEVINMAVPLIAQLLQQAEAAGKLEGGKNAVTRLADIATIQTVIDEFLYQCIGDLHELNIIELPRYFTY